MTHQGQKRTAYEFTIVVERDGARKRTRRVFPTRAEATEASLAAYLRKHFRSSGR